jgi:hypothetical protein
LIRIDDGNAAISGFAMFVFAGFGVIDLSQARTEAGGRSR